MSLNLACAYESDLAVLTQMNKGLIDDEGSPNPMTILELEERMKDWLMSDWNIDLIYKNSEIVGYALCLSSAGIRTKWNKTIERKSI